jgi:hypothetical protein
MRIKEVWIVISIMTDPGITPGAWTVTPITTGHGILTKAALTVIWIMMAPGIMAQEVSTVTWITTVRGTTTGAA